MSFISDFTKPPEDVVIDLINFDNGTAFTKDTLLVVGAPVAIPKAPPTFRNTTITVRPTASTKKFGTAQLWYNRIDLATVPGTRSVLFDVDKTATMLSDLVPLINERYHINLTPEDYINAPLPPLTSAPSPVNIQAAPGSLVYIGVLNVNVEIGANGGIPIVTVAPNRFLSIFQFLRSGT